MPSEYCEVFRRHARLLTPIATGWTPVLRPLSGVRAVLFDLYGTLLVSGSGEVGTEAGPSDSAMAEAMATVGIRPRGEFDHGASVLFETIEAMHDEARREGRDYPEIDVREAWRRVLAELERAGRIEPAGQGVDLARLAVEYEARANPVWPMPGWRECIEALRGRGFLLGIISNAQFYTPPLFEALFDDPPEAFGFDSQLLYYSYQYGWGKPSVKLFEPAVAALAQRAISPGEVIYVGNDMLHDVMPARRVGFRAALFAGDKRSLRPREGDARLEGIAADVVVTDLGQLAECLIT